MARDPFLALSEALGKALEASRRPKPPKPPTTPPPTTPPPPGSTLGEAVSHHYTHREATHADDND
jgi:hypothetical protein